MTSCPCCGSELKSRLPADKLRHLSLPRMQRDVLATVLKHYPSPVRSEVIIDQMYQLDPNGGPLNPRNNLGVHIHHLNQTLKSHGWRIDAVGRDRRVLTRIEANA